MDDEEIFSRTIKAHKRLESVLIKQQPAVFSHFSVLENRWLTICLLPRKREFG